jgi:NhaA family Na+:H+ antiporter
MNDDPLLTGPSPLEPMLRPLRAFLAAESSGAMLLLSSTIIALLWANSPWGDRYAHFWHTPVSLHAAGRTFDISLAHGVNDGLMAIFFLLVGLEIKRELLIGELASPRRAALPLAAAIGGMVMPALLYTALNIHRPGAPGWGIPMATDIAFAAGVLALVGRAVPTSVRVFLLAIAIIDDLGAVLVIAVCYTSQISAIALAITAALFALLIVLNRLHVRRLLPYLLLGLFMWLAMLFSGLHATIAGVLLAFTIPAPREKGDHAPLAKLEHALLKPVNFLIVPLFALANAGVDLRGSGAAALASPISWGVVIGLLIGKPLGVSFATFAAIKTGIGTLPTGATVRQIVGISLLCGIGFTMSLFIANLAFPGRDAHLTESKVGILTGSLICGILGALTIRSKHQAALRARR